MDLFRNAVLTVDRQLFWQQPWVSIEENKMRIKEKGEKLVEELGRSPLPTEFGDFTYVVFGDRTNHAHHELMIFGNLEEGSLEDGENVLVRVHSSCRTNEVYHAVNCECRKELQKAMTDIAEEGKGVLVYLEQEGRGTGITGKMAQLNGMFGWENGKIEQKRDPETNERIDTDRAYKEAGYPSECRDFSVAGAMLAHVGIKSVRLMTNNPNKIQAMTDAGIEVVPVSLHIEPDNEIIASDLKSKAVNLGHNITENEWRWKNE